MSGSGTTGRDLALYDLIRHVAYAEGQWIMHTEAFDAAMNSMGMRWVWGKGLFQADTKIPDPYSP